MSAANPVYVVETAKTYAQAAVDLRRAVEAAKWGILGGYELSEIMSAKGFAQSEPFRSLDICAPAHAAALAGADRLTALCMPCSVLVYVEDGRTKLATMQPGAVLPQVFPDAAATLGPRAAQIDAELRAILDTAAR